MKNIIDTIYDLDDIHLTGNSFEDEKKSALDAVVKAESALVAAYPECRELFEEYREAALDIQAVSNRAEFHRGFVVGALVVLEIKG